MADIAIGVYGHSGTGSPGASQSVSFDTSGMANPTLVAGLYTSGSTSDKVTSVTFNGVAATRVDSVANSVDANERSYLYVLPACAVGNYTLTFNFTGSPASYEAAYGCYQNTNQSSQPDTYVSVGNVSASTLSLTQTSTVDKCWAVGWWRAQLTLTNGSGTTMRDTYGGINHALADSNGNVTPAGSKTLTLTTSPAAGWAGIMCFIKPEVLALPKQSRIVRQAVNRSSTY